jgi:hypothetical protein
MVKVPFKYYLHDDATGRERAEMILDQIDLDMDSEQFAQMIGRPFYEVTLHCSLDTDTGKVSVESVEL